MTKKKTQLLGKQLGSHMIESAGANRATADRYDGFIPSESTSGDETQDPDDDTDQSTSERHSQEFNNG